MSMKVTSKITPFLWFDGRAEEAATFYTAIFPQGKIVDQKRYGEAGPGQPGKLMSATFELEGQRFIALNGGPQFQFTPAISFFITCETQQEVDHYWARLAEDGGEHIQCGWLKDKFGVSWQVVPRVLGEMLGDRDAARSQRVMTAMMQMKKLDIARLEQAFGRT
jgi:predicted 3-demethylubiquinone-9 3-methyltransferase (glyoxalase superfamily)